MAKSGLNTFVQLCNYLQKPCHVARFQNICGVEGTSVANGTEEKALPNGACSGPPDTDDVKYPVRRNRQAPRTQERHDDSSSYGNGTAHLEASGHDMNTAPGDGGQGSPTGPAAVVDSIDRAKPLRRNSLTGDAGQEFIIHNKVLFYLFTFGTELGNEMFFIIFFPFLCWNVDALVSRRLIVVWAWNLFFGQCTKDLVRWSRPASPPVVKVEVFYNSEYSMPSTHAMTGTAIPFCVFYLSYGRWEYPFVLGLCVAVCWSVLVCASRVYMGMHSILEVITGSLYTLVILAVLLPALESIDHFYMSGYLAPLVILAVHVGFGLLAFTLDSWSTSRGDTAQGLATAAGAALATHINHQLGLWADPLPSTLPFTAPTISTALLLHALLRFSVGVAILLVTRTVMKVLTIPLLCRLFRLPPGNVRLARQHMRVELPYRYIVYSVVGFCCVCPVPLLFSLLNL